MQPKRSIPARLGSWSAQHSRKAVLGWLLFVVLAFVVGGKVGLNELDPTTSGNGESNRANEMILAGDFPDEAGEQVLIQGKGSIKSGDPEIRAAVRDVVDSLDKLPGVKEIQSPLDPEHKAQTVSRDGRSVVVNFTMPGTELDLADKIDAPLAAVAAVQKAHPDVRVEEVGGVSIEKAMTEQSDKDGKKSELVSYVITLLILLTAFGAFVAAGIPLILGATAVVGTMGLLGPVSHILELSPNVAQVVVVLGLAVGVDYAMFYLRREMEERAKGRSADDAIAIAAATSGRAVLVSGLTVMTAMAGLLLSGNPVFSSFGVGTMVVVAVAVLGSMTALPGLIAALSRRGWTEKGRVPFVTKRRRRNGGESKLWSAVLDRVLRRPLVSAVLAGGLLVALTIPALGLQFKDAGIEGFSRSLPIMKTYDRVDAAFPGGVIPAQVVVKAKDVTAPKVQEAITQLHDEAIATGALSEPSDVTVSPNKKVAIVSLAIDGNGTDAASVHSVDVLRDEVVPATVGKTDGAEVAVAGLTATSNDFLDTMKARLPLVFGFVLTLAFVLMLVTFRSLVVPIKAIVLNLLSVGAAYGAMVLVFQDGHGEKALDFQSVGGIGSWIPLFLFVILFGLSMDYHVFILSRVREGVDRGMSTSEAVAEGIKSTAGVVTSAAFVMVAVFASFMLQMEQEMKQLGFGLAFAIFIDATIVRAVLLPATMKLLGERNWWLPKGLSWLPRFEHEPEVVPAAA